MACLGNRKMCGWHNSMKDTKIRRCFECIGGSYYTSIDCFEQSTKNPKVCSCLIILGSIVSIVSAISLNIVTCPCYCCWCLTASEKKEKYTITIEPIAVIQNQPPKHIII